MSGRLAACHHAPSRESLGVPQVLATLPDPENRRIPRSLIELIGAAETRIPLPWKPVKMIGGASRPFHVARTTLIRCGPVKSFGFGIGAAADPCHDPALETTAPPSTQPSAIGGGIPHPLPPGEIIQAAARPRSRGELVRRRRWPCHPARARKSLHRISRSPLQRLWLTTLFLEVRWTPSRGFDPLSACDPS